MGIEIGLEAGGEGAEVAGELDLLVYRLDVEAELAGLGGAVAAVRAGEAAPVLALGVPLHHLRRAARVVAHPAGEGDAQVLGVHVRGEVGLVLAGVVVVVAVVGLGGRQAGQDGAGAVLHLLVRGQTCFVVGGECALITVHKLEGRVMHRFHVRREVGLFGTFKTAH